MQYGLPSNKIKTFAKHAIVTYSDESGFDQRFGKKTYYDGRSHIKTKSHFRFSKMSIYFEYLPFKISPLEFLAHFCFQCGHVMTSAVNRLQEASLE